MFVRPFQRTIINIITHNRAADIGLSKHDASKTQPIFDRIALINMVSRDHVIGAAHDSKMAKLRGPVVA